VAKMTIEQAFAKKFAEFFDNNAFNGVIGVGVDGDVIYKEAWGIANPNEDELKTSSIFNLASVSKQFTALCIMMLYQDEALHYDDLICNYLPEFENKAYQDITIRHLLQHTSGLADYEEVVDEHWDSDEIVTNDDILALFAEHEPDLLFKVGKKHDYCNTGYAFLASIVERVSESSFEDFLQERIFEPLAMKHSFGYRISSGKPPYKKVVGFEVVDDEYVESDSCYVDGIIGDGNIFSNVDDLIKYNAALFTNELVSQKTLAEAYKPTKLSNGEIYYYGFGWDLYESGEFVSHTGSWMGFRSYFLRDLSSKQVFIALDNSTNEALYEQVDAVVDPFYG
jgi:CubicO group peptidase (beta-lactamase class C family)